MILEETLNKLLRDTVNLLLDSPAYTIKSKPSKRRPKGSYGSVSFMSDTGIGTEQRTFENNTTDDDMTETITGMRQVMFSIDFYRDNARDNARAVRTKMVRESIQSLFRTTSVGLTRRSEVRDVSEPLENGWEERAQFDIVLSVVGTDSDIVNAIASVYMNAKYELNGRSVDINIGDDLSTKLFGFFDNPSAYSLGELEDNSIGGRFVSVDES